MNIFEKNWPTHRQDLWGIDEELDKIKHYDILPRDLMKLRKADKIEIQAGNITEFK